jgi:hypothetical protein
MSLGENGTSERVIGTLVSGNYFDVLGTRARPWGGSSARMRTCPG